MAGKQVEASDMNDGDILAATTQIPCGKNGGSQFKYVLPDGHEIKSECVSAEQKKQALHVWVDAVKQARVSRINAQREELAAQIRRRKADEAAAQEAQNAASMGLIVPAGTANGPGVQTAPAALVGPSPAPALAPAPSDPVAMARSELTRASLEVQRLRPMLQEAEARMKQWATVLHALNSTELPQESAVISTDNRLIQER